MSDQRSPSSPTEICLENDSVRAYQMSNNSSLKKLLMQYCNIDSMFGSLNFEPK